MAKVSITFLTDYEVQDGSGTCYKAGKKLTTNPESAQHFIRRGVAELNEKGRPAQTTGKAPATTAPAADADKTDTTNDNDKTESDK